MTRDSRLRDFETATSVFDCVTDAAQGANQWPRKATIDLVAQVVNVDLDDVRSRLAIVAPDVFGDLILAEHATGVAHQVAKQVELLGGELDRRVAAPRLVPRQVRHQVADA